MYKYRKAQSVLEYSLLAAVLVGALLAMQVYVKRGVAGQVKMTTDGLAEQYAIGEIKLHEHFSSTMSSTEWKFPGPYDVTNSHGSYNTNSKRELEPLPVK